MANYLFATTLLSEFFGGDFSCDVNSVRTTILAPLIISLTKPIALYKGFSFLYGSYTPPLPVSAPKVFSRCRRPSTLNRLDIQRRSQLNFLKAITRPTHRQTLSRPLILKDKSSYKERGSHDSFSLVAVRLSLASEKLRAPLAEFLGVGIFVLMGTASDCQAVLSTNPEVSQTPKGTFLSLAFGWAAGAALGVWLSVGISGAHINPAITLGLAFWKKFSWKKVPFYILAQVAGGFVGAASTYGQYLQPINIYEGSHTKRTIGTAGLFAAFPAGYLSPIPIFTSELVGTAILTLMILATTDKHNAAPDLSLFPIAIFIIVLSLGVSWGMETYSFNPARDFGCRLFLSMVGYGGVMFSYRGQYWLWGGFIAPTLGAIIAIGFYDLLLRRKDPVQTVVRDSLKTGVNAI